MGELTTSVALCTYNGERFLAEQIESILNQSHPVDEIVVRDDGSTDGTCALIDEYAARHPGFIRSCRAEVNGGSNRNFQACIELCRNDVVLLCDQDDAWHEDKVARLVAPLVDPRVGFAFSDANMVDTMRSSIGYTLWQAIGFDDSAQAMMASELGFDLLLRRFVVTGATMAVRREIAMAAMPYSTALVHDAWIALFAAAVSEARPVDARLVDYRQHASQQIGECKRNWYQQYQMAKKMGLAKFEERLLAFQTLHDRLVNQTTWSIEPRKLAMLQQKIDFLKQRVEMRRSGWRLPAVLRQWTAGNYSRFAEGWKAVGQDLMMP